MYLSGLVYPLAFTGSWHPPFHPYNTRSLVRILSVAIIEYTSWPFLLMLVQQILRLGINCKNAGCFCTLLFDRHFLQIRFSQNVAQIYTKDEWIEDRTASLIMSLPAISTLT
jgi:hypothetical protein